jgi:hypothetical protein
MRGEEMLKICFYCSCLYMFVEGMRVYVCVVTFGVALRSASVR